MSQSGINRRTFVKGLLAASAIGAPFWAHGQGKGKELVLAARAATRPFWTR